MIEYFRLQFRMANRMMADFGTHPVLGYIFLPLIFIGGSVFLFSKTEYAAYVYILFAYLAFHHLSDVKRNDFLKICFRGKFYHRLRTIENGIVATPFLLFLAFKALLVPALIVTALAMIMANFNFELKRNLVIPTPFSKKPFEFIVGFRSAYLLFALAYFIAVMSVWANNFNLGAFSVMLMFLISLSFYVEPEQEYFVWSNNVSPLKFLTEKIRISVLQSTLLTLPVAISLGFFFSENWLILVGIQLLGYAALATVILAKYSAYPERVSLPQGILIALTLQFPVLLIVVIPVFYWQSLKRLNRYLG